MEEEQSFPAAIAELFYTQRINLVMTQKQVAEEANIDPSHYGKIERGKVIPNALTFFSLMCVLGIDKDDIAKKLKKVISER